MLFFDDLGFRRHRPTSGHTCVEQLVVIVWIVVARLLLSSCLEAFDNLRWSRYIGAVSTMGKTASDPAHLAAQSVFAPDGRAVLDSPGHRLASESSVFSKTPDAALLVLTVLGGATPWQPAVV